VPFLETMGVGLPGPLVAALFAGRLGQGSRTPHDGLSSIEICEAEEQSVKTGQIVLL